MTIARRGSTNYSIEWSGAAPGDALTKEPSVQVGDIILIGVSAYSAESAYTGGTTTISGFTKLVDVIYDAWSEGATKGTIYYRVVDGSEGSSFPIGVSGNYPYGSAALIAFSGDGLFIEDSDSTDNAEGTSPSAPSVTAEGSGRMLLSFFLYADPATFTAPSGSDGAFANSPQNTNGSAVSWDAIASSGETGARTATLGTARDCLGVSVLLAESGGAPSVNAPAIVHHRTQHGQQ